MKNSKRFCFVMSLLAISICLSVSCSKEPDEIGNIKKFTFENCITTIKMQLPGKWTTYTKYYDNPSYYIKNIISMNITNELEYSLNSDNGIDFEINAPYFVFDGEIDSLKVNNEKLYNEIINKKEYVYGGNHIFVDADSKNGFVFIDSKMILRLNIKHWPKNGITQEMESFFSSLHID